MWEREDWRRRFNEFEKREGNRTGKQPGDQEMKDVYDMGRRDRTQRQQHCVHREQSFNDETLRKKAVGPENAVAFEPCSLETLVKVNKFKNKLKSKVKETEEQTRG